MLVEAFISHCCWARDLFPQILFILLCIFYEGSFRKTWHCTLSYSLFLLSWSCIVNLFMCVLVVSQVVFLWLLSKVGTVRLTGVLSQTRTWRYWLKKSCVLIFVSVLTKFNMYLFTYSFFFFFFLRSHNFYQTAIVVS